MLSSVAVAIVTYSLLLFWTWCFFTSFLLRFSSSICCEREECRYGVRKRVKSKRKEVKQSVVRHAETRSFKATITRRAKDEVGRSP